MERERRQFGRRDSRLIVTSRGKPREYRISFNAIAITFIALSVFFTGYVGATAYIAFREDLVAGTLIRQARIKHEYEDRIAALRSEVDRITSRQLLDQQAIEAKVAALMEQQTLLTGQGGALEGLLEKARDSGIDTTLQPDPARASDQPQRDAALQQNASDAIDPITTAAIAPSTADWMSEGLTLRGSAIGGTSSAAVPLIKNAPKAGSRIRLASKSGDIEIAGHADAVSILGGVKQRIAEIEKRQLLGLVSIKREAANKAHRIAGLYKKLDLKAPSELTQAIGGPYEPGKPEFEDFSALAHDVEQTLDTLTALSDDAQRLPLANPVPGAKISSHFGNRRDPFRGTTAFHGGTDFKAVTGTAVRAAGDGTVVHAGRKGGYGLLVEIDHGNGITTRYAHLSRILVKKGQTVGKGKRVGKVGSTGRSTGPHLHYEVRRYDKPRNPIRYLKAGREWSDVL